jgi:hypothetical protein
MLSWFGVGPDSIVRAPSEAPLTADNPILTSVLSLSTELVERELSAGFVYTYVPIE